MLSQRQIFRAVPRLTAQLRGSAGRRSTTAQRRFASTDNEFVRERKAVKEHAAGTTELWRKISLYINAWNLYNEHIEHEKHKPPLEERVEYSYQNIRTKNYPWGNGDQTLFWNPKVNYHNKDKVA